MRNIIKYALCLTLVLMLIMCSVSTASAASSGTIGNVLWNYNTSTYTLTVSLASGTTGVIPDYTETLVAPWYTSYRTNIKYIVIGEGITKVGNYAFSNCSSATQVTFPSTLTEIGSFAFLNDVSLSRLTIPENVTSIGLSAFYNCSLLNTLDFNAKMCTEMGTKNYPPFYKCASLTNINIGSNVKSIPPNAFAGCTNISSISLPDNVVYISECSFYSCTGLRSITMSDKITSIPELAFFNCTSLTSFTLPRLVSSIGERAFGKCISLTTLTIPSTVTSIAPLAFDGDSNLTLNVTTGSYAYEYADVYSINMIPSQPATGGSTIQPSVVTNTNLSILNGKLNVFVKFDKTLTDECVHIAYYNSSNKVVDYMIVPIVSPLDHIYLVTNDISSATYAKVFIWDSLETCMPVSTAEYIQINRP